MKEATIPAPQARPSGLDATTRALQTKFQANVLEMARLHENTRIKTRLREIEEGGCGHA